MATPFGGPEDYAKGNTEPRRGSQFVSAGVQAGAISGTAHDPAAPLPLRGQLGHQLAEDADAFRDLVFVGERVGEPQRVLAT